jgi:hypothetical protein
MEPQDLPPAHQKLYSEPLESFILGSLYIPVNLTTDKPLKYFHSVQSI